MAKVSKEISEYMSSLAKLRKKKPKKYYQDLQKKSVASKRKKLSTVTLAK